MAWPTAQKNNVIAGAFLLAALVLAVLTSAVLSGVNLESTRDYTVRFDMDTGAPGVKPGSTVTVGGKEAGAVTKVEFYMDPNGRPAGIDVGFTLTADLTLGEDAEIFLQKPLLGALSTLNVADVGDPSKPAGNKPLSGETAPPSFLADAGYGDGQRNQLQNILANADKLTRDLGAMVDEWSANSTPIAEDTRAALQSLRASLERVEQRLPEWDQGITDTIDTTRKFATDLDGLGQRADVSVTNAGRFIENLNQRLDTTGPKIDAAATDAAAIAADLRTAVARETPTIRQTMANLLVMSEQAALTIQEIRAEPWRVLFRPSTKELETQLLYDSTRALAAGAARLSDASASLSADPTDQDTRAQVQALQKQLQEAADELFVRLKKDAK